MDKDRGARKNATIVPDDIDNGRLSCIIGIAPAKPTEFVVFRIRQ